MGLQSLPPEVIDWIVEDLVRAIGIYKTVQLRLVSSTSISPLVSFQYRKMG